MTEQESHNHTDTTEVERTEINASESETQPEDIQRIRKPRLRIIPIWLRIILSIVLIGGSLLLGLMVGYGVIGGGSPADVLKPETWYHILDIIRGE